MNPNNENHEQNGGPVINIINDKVCRDYVWGKCMKAQCKFVHECDLQIMLNILRFCHDFQNSTGCKRPNCTFLHSTREEEKLFREDGQFPSDLAKRHSQMHAAHATMSRKFQDTYVNRPPPPSLENQQVPPQMLMVNPIYQTAPRWFLRPPPPPPPPPREPSPTPPQYTDPPPPAPAAAPAYHSQTGLPYPARSAYNQQVLPQQIDISKPPPQPVLMQQVKNGSLKRLPEAHEGSPPNISTTPYIPQPLTDALSLDTSKPPPKLFPTVQQPQSILGKRAHTEGFDLLEAGPSKRKATNSQSSSCENCTSMELRNFIIETKISELLTERACAVLKYEEKKNEIANIVDLLSCLATPQSDSSTACGVTEISTSLDDTILRALVANHMKDKSNLLPKQSTSSMLRMLTGLLHDSDASSSSTTNGNGLERLLELDVDLHRPELTSQPPASAPHSFPKSVVPTHASVPPMPPQFTQAYRPMQHHTYQFPAGPSNGAAQAINKPVCSTSASMQPAPVLPPYSDQNTYYMMGRPPPPFQ